MASTLLLSPNPTSGSIWADLELKNPSQFSMQIFDAVGKMVWQKTFQSATTQVRQELDLGGFAEGIYLLKIQTEDGIISGRILKQ
ncbi:MAG: T9SS type A sorting domain-containing protein [Saprospiraceae bacterium]|nr:T9SS type A sorting domain-containing protein [Saprospiraceae bacterium]